MRPRAAYSFPVEGDGIGKHQEDPAPVNHTHTTGFRAIQGNAWPSSKYPRCFATPERTPEATEAAVHELRPETHAVGMPCRWFSDISCDHLQVHIVLQVLLDYSPYSLM